MKKKRKKKQKKTKLKKKKSYLRSTKKIHKTKKIRKKTLRNKQKKRNKKKLSKIKKKFVSLKIKKSQSESLVYKLVKFQLSFKPKFKFKINDIANCFVVKIFENHAPLLLCAVVSSLSTREGTRAHV